MKEEETNNKNKNSHIILWRWYNVCIFWGKQQDTSLFIITEELCTANQNWASYVCYLKMINTVLKNKMSINSKVALQC